MVNYFMKMQKSKTMKFTKDENLVLNRLIVDNCKSLENLDSMISKIENKQLREKTIDQSKKAQEMLETILFKIENLTE